VLTSVQTESIQAAKGVSVNELQRIATTGTLENIAGEINHYHAKCEEAAGQAVAYAKEAGDRLRAVKEDLGHGAWLPWLEKNFKGTARTAQVYMRIAQNWPELEMRSTASHLSIRGALGTLELEEKSEPARAPFGSTYTPDGRGGWDVEHHYSMEEYAEAHGYRVSPPLLVDVEFSALLPALQDAEYAGLEKSLLHEGCRDAIVAWNNTILDGHARYEICVKHGLDYLVCDKEMDSRTDAVIYIINSQLGRKNLSALEKAYVREQAWEETPGEEP